MATRARVHITLRSLAYSPPPPDAVVPEVTVDLRVFWPQVQGNEQIVLAKLGEAYQDARRQILAAFEADFQARHQTRVRELART